MAEDVRIRMLNIVHKVKTKMNKTKVISADLLGLNFDFDFEGIFRFCNISIMVTFQFS